jgi:hypothetical protein
MRRPRTKADGAGYYHAVSRIIEKRHILGDREKQRLLDLLRRLAFIMEGWGVKMIDSAPVIRA